MKLLLDTHCWLWLKFDASRLPSPLRRRLSRHPDNLVLSSASVMEIVIKQATGNLTLVSADPQVLAYDVATLDARK